MNPESTIIFADGASRGNPGPGGFGAVIVYNNSELKVESEKLKVEELGGREEHTTNNRMELTAVISALSFLSKVNCQRSIVIYSDSSYVINGITKWVFGWQKNNWKTKAKGDVLNKDLWERLADLVKDKKIEWKYVGGHVGIAGNERCDVIATSFADKKEMKLYSGSLEDYPIKNILDINEDSIKRENKEKTKSKSKGKAYSYVSKVDGKIETHETWADCEKRVKGKSGAKYKKSFSKEDESSIIGEWE